MYSEDIKRDTANKFLKLRADVIMQRTYSRPIYDKTGVQVGQESFKDIINRVIDHQTWLWERALQRPLRPVEIKELDELKEVYLKCSYGLPSGRTLWLGGTETGKKREASMFNCSFLRVETVYDIVDAFWLLLQGCGVGFTPVVGTLTGFKSYIPKITFIRSTRTDRGNPDNSESFDASTGIWMIQIGDSAEAWTKAVGKLLAGKYSAKELVIDLSQIRPAGERLKGYGWISSGDASFHTGLNAIVKILNNKADSLLSNMDILDIMNWLGTVLTSRRSAEICLIPFESPEWKEFAYAKRNLVDEPQRSQSNNSLVFYSRPTEEQLKEVFDIIVESGGSEPGIVNAEAALKRAPWFKGMNP